ncbi:MAG: tetratricopeptide repeat protein [bacterium]|nr:tetratricopeptide repeat protein [bacterium]
MGSKIENLQEVLQKDPSNFQIRRELSVELLNEGFNEEALANLKYLEKYFPDDADLAYNIGIVSEKMKDFVSAESAYKKAVSLSTQPDFYYNLGEVLVSLESWDEAISAFKEVLKTDPEDGNCYFNLGLCYFHKEELNTALDNFEQAVKYNPKDIFAHFYMGNIYKKNGLTNFAIKCYQKVLEISPDYSWAYFNLASIAYENGNMDEAKSNLLLTIEYNKQDIEAYKLLTKLSIKDNDLESILTILHDRLENYEANGDLYYILAQVYKYMGNKDEYAKHLSLALENSLSLTYSQEIVEKEFKRLRITANIDIVPPPELEEIDNSEEYDENNEEIDDEYEDKE